jgi:SAM-dependent methyltransferase
MADRGRISADPGTVPFGMDDLPEPVIPPDIPDEMMPSLLENWFLGTRAKRWLSRRRFAAVTGALPGGRGERALDVGCGWGYNLFLLGRRGYQPFGIDIVPEDFFAAVSIARANGITAGLTVADMSRMPFGDGAFAAVTAVETFEHIFRSDREAAIREAYRVLRPGGVLVISTPNYYSLVEAGKRLVSRFPQLKRILPGMCYPAGEISRDEYHPYSYHNPSPAGEIRSLIEGRGFEVSGMCRIIFVLKTVPDALFGLSRSAESLMERTPLVRLLAATLVIRADKPL